MSRDRQYHVIRAWAEWLQMRIKIGQEYFETINNMVRNHDTYTKGKFIKKIMKETDKIGEIKKVSKFQKSLKRLPKYTTQTIENSTRVIKSHLSHNR